MRNPTTQPCSLLPEPFPTARHDTLPHSVTSSLMLPCYHTKTPILCQAPAPIYFDCTEGLVRAQAEEKRRFRGVGNRLLASAGGRRIGPGAFLRA